MTEKLEGLLWFFGGRLADEAFVAPFFDHGGNLLLIDLIDGYFSSCACVEELDDVDQFRDWLGANIDSGLDHRAFGDVKFKAMVAGFSGLRQFDMADPAVERDICIEVAVDMFRRIGLALADDDALERLVFEKSRAVEIEQWREPLDPHHPDSPWRGSPD